jgi:hypothetical protein
MVSIQKRLDQTHFTSDRERQFYSHSLNHLSTSSGCIVEIDKWTITSLEVEFGPKIGSGGLYVFSSSKRYAAHSVAFCSGEVLKGTWNKTPVALKVLRTDQGMTPSIAVCFLLFSPIYLACSIEHEDDAERDQGQFMFYNVNTVPILSCRSGLLSLIPTLFVSMKMCLLSY